MMPLCRKEIFTLNMGYGEAVVLSQKRKTDAATGTGSDIETTPVDEVLPTRRRRLTAEDRQTC